MRRELGVGPDESLAVTVANLRAGKNYPGLIDAARIVVDRGVPVRFVTAGQGQLEAEIGELHRQSGLGDRFALLGYRDDTTRLIAAADLFVLASHHEGLPVTVMEALTLGVPVVAPAVGRPPPGRHRRRERPARDTRLADRVGRRHRAGGRPDGHARLVAGAQQTGDRFSSAHAVAASSRATKPSPPIVAADAHCRARRFTNASTSPATANAGTHNASAAHADSRSPATRDA